MHVPPYTIDDPIESPERAGVDVTIEFPAGKRWLFFITPDQLASAGDYRAEAISRRRRVGERTVAYGEEAAA